MIPGLLESVHRFASVSAELADPFAVRPATLHRHDLDEQAWARVCETWKGRFSGDADTARAFARAYATERQRIRTGGPRPLTTQGPADHGALSFPNHAPRADEPADLGDMTALPVSRSVAVVPFVSGSAEAARARLAESLRSPERPDSDDLDETQQIALEDTSLTLPFYKPAK
ncbi:MAG: hypothetical protein WKG00_19560 [Polyangiaceae bacterium]